MSESHEGTYNAKLNDIDNFRTKVSTYLRMSVNSCKINSYVYLLSAIFEPIVLNGFKITNVSNSGSVCLWMDNYEDSFMYLPESKDLYRKLRTLRNSIVHINISCEDDFKMLSDTVHETSYPIFEQCMNDLLLDFKDLYDMQSIYVKLGGNKETLPDDELRLFD